MIINSLIVMFYVQQCHRFSITDAQTRTVCERI